MTLSAQIDYQQEEYGPPVKNQDTLIERLRDYPHDPAMACDWKYAQNLMREAATALEEYERRSELNPLSGYSCNGINVWGDENSMKAVRKAFHRSAQLEEFQKAFDINLADKDAKIEQARNEIAETANERDLAIAQKEFWRLADGNSVARAEAAEAEAAALRERLERSSKQIEYALTKASLSAPEKISDALSLTRAFLNSSSKDEGLQTGASQNG